ncbi:hypothetical protein PsorP6_019431 [Peronosclerospora sorghi]|nr:hypothetical protein PsorP6_019431 [Peronosclerospora sorghi]
MMACELANGRCKFESSTTRACRGENTFLKAVANIIGRCTANNAILSLAYENESYSSSNLNAAYAAAQTAFRANVGAAMRIDNFSVCFRNVS